MNSSDSIMAALAATPKPDSMMFQYGTAGFRTRHSVLPSTCLRMGMLAVLRSQAAGGRYVGVMITASHNAEEDNGIKLVDPSGYMLQQDWEPSAETLANAVTAEEAVEVISSLRAQFCIEPSQTRAYVVVGRDTRPHSQGLSDFVKLGVTLLGESILIYI